VGYNDSNLHTIILESDVLMTKKPLAKTSADVLSYVDPLKPVQIYRNLHKDCMSVRQGGIVVCHADAVVLKNVTFVVGEAGRERVRRERKKNVHAYVKGFVVDAREMATVQAWVGGLWDEVYYNPYTCDHFKSGDDYVAGAMYVDIDCQSCEISPQIIAFGLTYHKQMV
jgi:hypothetical protein